MLQNAIDDSGIRRQPLQQGNRPISDSLIGTLRKFKQNVVDFWSFVQFETHQCLVIDSLNHFLFL